LLFSLAFFSGLSGAGSTFLQSTKLQEVADGLAQNFAEKLGRKDIDIAALPDIFQIIEFFETLAIVVFVGQLVFTGLMLKLSWEQRWYMVGERSLRIRHGLWSVREQTMTIANIQNMTVRQGPLQRLFGFSDLEISTAGGGQSSSGEDPTEQKDSFHIGRFRGVENAAELRDKLRRRLTAVQAAGAPDEEARPIANSERDDAGPRATVSQAGAIEPGTSEPSDIAGAARALLAEARALRREVSQQV
jgi:membrane protein YdbS with pleckstrin-like domain